MQKKLVVSSSPFIRNTAASTQRIMLDVIIALLPTTLAAVWFFGGMAIAHVLVAVFFAVASEYLFERLTHQPVTITDLSAVVTGILVALNLPSSAPWWMSAIGSVLAIVLVKQMFGGIGQNFVNPALAARTILMLSWTGLIAAKSAACGGAILGLASEVDAVTSGTPLVNHDYSLLDLFLGNCPGMMGETCKIALLLGGIYLFVRKVADWRISLTFVATSFVLFLIKDGAQEALYQILSGGLLLGAIFMATDYATSPITKWGRVIMGIGCGAFLFIIRSYNNSYPEGCSFAILFMNILTPLIDKWTMPRTFGVKKGGAHA